MKITSIKQQVKRTDRYSIFVDEKYSFSLSEGALLKSAIASGQELSAQQVAEFKQLSSDDKTYNLALRYVAMRSRSTWELETYLSRKQLSEQLVADHIEHLTELGLLNDAAYAISFIRNRELLKPTSRRKLQLELKQKHISEADITAAFEEVQPSEQGSLQQLIEKKRRQSKYQDDTKLMQYLARQGYGYSDIKHALSADDETY